jgi:hypothetical protein
MKVRYQADNDPRKSIVRGAVRREPLINFRSPGVLLIPNS